MSDRSDIPPKTSSWFVLSSPEWGTYLGLGFWSRRGAGGFWEAEALRTRSEAQALRRRLDPSEIAVEIVRVVSGHWRHLQEVGLHVGDMPHNDPEGSGRARARPHIASASDEVSPSATAPADPLRCQTSAQPLRFPVERIPSARLTKSRVVQDRAQDRVVPGGGASPPLEGRVERLALRRLRSDVPPRALAASAHAALRAEDRATLRFFATLGAPDLASCHGLVEDLVADPLGRQDLRLALRNIGGVLTRDGDYEADSIAHRLHAITTRGFAETAEHGGPAWHEDALSHVRVVERVDPRGLRTSSGADERVFPVVLRHVGRDVAAPTYEPAYAREDMPNVWWSTPPIGLWIGPEARLHDDAEEAMREARVLAEALTLPDRRDFMPQTLPASEGAQREARIAAPSERVAMGWPAPTSPITVDPAVPAELRKVGTAAPLVTDRRFIGRWPDAKGLDAEAASEPIPPEEALTLTVLQAAPRPWPSSRFPSPRLFSGFIAAVAAPGETSDVRRLPGPSASLMLALAKTRMARDSVPHMDAVEASKSRAADAPRRCEPTRPNGPGA